MTQHSIDLVAIDGVKRMGLLNVVGHQPIMPEQGDRSSKLVEIPALRPTTGEQAHNVLFLTDQAIRLPISITSGTGMPEGIFF